MQFITAMNEHFWLLQYFIIYDLISVGNGVINLGTNADCVVEDEDDESNQCTGEFSGQLADLNIWNRVLSDEELIRFTNCRPDLDSPVGNVLNWQNSIWKKTKVTQVISLDI